MQEKIRCKWCNLKNPLYVKYHDEEWCKPNFNEKYLYEMLILESFQAGLSWECVLNKREDFRKAYDNFDIDKICEYNDKKIEQLLSNQKIIRNKLKIKASINNSKIFKNIQAEFGSFYNYLKIFTKKFPMLKVEIMQDSFGEVKWLEIAQNGVEKYKGIAEVAKLEGILNENIIAFGDGLNDVEMLKKCGVGVAMQNALPEVKEQADYITSRTNNENGVVEFLKEYLVEI